MTLTAATQCSCAAMLEIESDDPGGLYSLNLSGTVSAASGTCVPNATTLCLHDDRFEVTVQYFDHHNGGSGPGKKIDFSDRTGLFWFFSSANVEAIVKVLGPLNGYWWVFHGGLTDLAYTFTVRDTMTGNVATYEKSSGNLCGGSDTTALPDTATATVGAPLFSRGEFPASPTAAEKGAGGTCLPGSTRLCLLDQRFSVEVDYLDPGTGTIKSGTVEPFNDRTGFFRFFNPNNIEVPVKMVDATAPPFEHYWVFFGSLTDVSYTVRVTDTVTGAVRTYLSGDPLCGQSDTTAFPP